MNSTPRTSLIAPPCAEVAKRIFGVRNLKGKNMPKWKYSCGKSIRQTHEHKPEPEVELAKMAVSMFTETCQPIVNSFVEEVSPFWDPTIPLSDHQLINGIPGTKIDSLDLTKATGWPTGGKKGDWIVGRDPGVREMTAELKRDLSIAEANVENGERSGVICTACLKDEPVGIDPATGKPKFARVFFVSHLIDHLLNLRFMSCVFQLMTMFPVHFETSIGLDPTGPSMFPTLSALCHPEFVRNSFDIDYAGYDSNQSYALRQQVFRLMLILAKQMKVSDYHYLMLENLLRGLLIPLVNMFGTVMIMPNLLPSGFLGTAHCNGLGSVIMIRYDFLLFLREVCPVNISKIEWLRSRLRYFSSLGICDQSSYPDLLAGKLNILEFVRITTLGDDIIGSASNFYKALGWSPTHYVRTLALHWGLTATGGDKTSNVPFKNFENCEFLKRFYYYNPELKMNTLIKTPASYLRPFYLILRTKGWDEAEYYAEQIRSLIRECVYGGRELFELRHPQCIEFLNTCRFPIPEEVSWNYDTWVWNITSSGFWKPQPRLIDGVNESALRLIREYNAQEERFDEKGHFINNNNNDQE